MLSWRRDGYCGLITRCWSPRRRSTRRGRWSAELQAAGAKAIVAAEAFSVDDPARETRVIETAREMGMPATGTHEISGRYGLRVRTRDGGDQREPTSQDHCHRGHDGTGGARERLDGAADGGAERRRSDERGRSAAAAAAQFVLRTGGGGGGGAHVFAGERGRVSGSGRDEHGHHRDSARAGAGADGGGGRAPAVPEYAGCAARSGWPGGLCRGCGGGALWTWGRGARTWRSCQYCAFCTAGGVGGSQSGGGVAVGRGSLGLRCLGGGVGRPRPTHGRDHDVRRECSGKVAEGDWSRGNADSASLGMRALGEMLGQSGEGAAKMFLSVAAEKAARTVRVLLDRTEHERGDDGIDRGRRGSGGVGAERGGTDGFADADCAEQRSGVGDWDGARAGA